MLANRRSRIMPCDHIIQVDVYIEKSDNKQNLATNTSLSSSVPHLQCLNAATIDGIVLYEKYI